MTSPPLLPAWGPRDLRFQPSPERRSPGDLRWLKALPAGVAFSCATAERRADTCSHLVIKLEKNAWAMCFGFGENAPAARADALTTMTAWFEADGSAAGVDLMKDAATAGLLGRLWDEAHAEVVMGQAPTVELDPAALARKRTPLSDPARLTNVHDLAELLDAAPDLTGLTISRSPALTADVLRAGLSRATRLRGLRLQDCPALVTAAALGGSQQLEVLVLERCPALGDDGWDQLRGLTSLRRLRLEGLPVTERALRSLVGLPALENVKVVDCRLTYSTELWQAGGWSARWEASWCP
jgi:hypothetical protein